MPIAVSGSTGLVVVVAPAVAGVAPPPVVVVGVFDRLVVAARGPDQGQRDERGSELRNRPGPHGSSPQRFSALTAELTPR